MNNDFLSDFQIIGSSIKNVRIKNDFVSLENRNSIKRKIDLSHSITSIDILEDGNILSGTVLLNIKVNISENKRKYNLDLSIEGCFNASNEMDKENFIQMLNVNGITSLYSIARGFVHGISAQTLAAGSVLLPMINVVAYSKNLDNQQN